MEIWAVLRPPATIMETQPLNQLNIQKLKLHRTPTSRRFASTPRVDSSPSSASCQASGGPGRGPASAESGTSTILGGVSSLAQMPSGNGKKWHPFWLVKFKGEPFPPPKKRKKRAPLGKWAKGPPKKVRFDSFSISHRSV